MCEHTPGCQQNVGQLMVHSYIKFLVLDNLNFKSNFTIEAFEVPGCMKESSYVGIAPR